MNLADNRKLNQAKAQKTLAMIKVEQEAGKAKSKRKLARDAAYRAGLERTHGKPVALKYMHSAARRAAMAEVRA